MTKSGLIEMAKLRIRKTSVDDLDSDVGQLVDVAFADLKRIGIDQSYLKYPYPDPLIVEAVLMYVKANFGSPDNQAELSEAYQTMCIKLKGGGYHRSSS